MKYNKSEIMKSAWNLFKMFQKWADPLSFSECLRRAWDNAKRTLEATKKLMSNDCMKVINGVRLGLRRTVAADYTMGWIVTGKTYAARKELKAAGFRWDPESRNWFTTDRKVAEYFF
nr:MAG TPA: hypothetical protein [Caudoviricetes sp.]